MNEELLVGSKTWNRMAEALKQEGFREGADSGKEKTLQIGFNQGFKEGLADGLLFGELNGITKVLNFCKIKGSEHSSNPETLGLDACVICKQPEVDWSDIPTIIEKQSSLKKAVLQSKINNLDKDLFNDLQVNTSFEDLIQR